MTVSGKMTRLMGMGSIVILMEHVMKVFGKRTDRMERVSKHGLMELSMMANTSKVKSMVLEHFTGQMEALTQVSL